MLKTTLILTVIALLPLANAQAQFTIPEFEEFEGKYTNEELGIEVTLPEGWSGMEFPSLPIQDSPMIGGFMAAPGGVDITGMTIGAPMMFLTVMDAKKLEEIKVTSPTELPSEPSEPEEPDCQVLSFSLIDIGGAKGMKGEVECTMEDENGNPMQVKMKGLWASQEKEAFIRTIQIMFMAKADEYDKYVQEFDNIISTLNISGARALAVDLDKEMVEKVMIDDTEAEIKISSNSIIKDFKFDEADKSVTFKVEGDDGTVGMTDVYLSNVLKGPYTVTINGEPIEAIPITDEEGNEGVKIIYMHSMHEIKIIGTEVVPEFPIAVLPILALITAVAIFMVRNKRFNI